MTTVKKNKKLEMKNENIVSTEKQLKCRLYYHVKLMHVKVCLLLYLTITFYFK